MRRTLSRVAVVCSVGAVVAALATAPADASGKYWFKYPGISCGPDQRAVISMVISGSGTINGEYAYGSGGGIAFGGFTYKGAGSHSTTTPSRVLNSYDWGTSGSVKVVSRGVSCR
jgi:hypothetical protein